MTQLNLYQQEKLPTIIKWQILSFLRVQWPEGFTGKNQFRDWISKPEDHPTSIVLTEGDTLISHAEVVWKNLTHRRETYKTYGLSGVFTYPSFRKQGYGLQVIKTAKEYIERTDGDIALFNSVHRGFYEKVGFIPIEAVKILAGDPQNPKLCNETAFMLFLSEKGKRGREYFEREAVYFGETTW